MEPVPDSEVGSSPAFYLPHHGVLREQSETTKLRVIFNGSSRTDNGISLNDILYSGAKLQTEIADVLLWFRLHQYVFSTDITKMYRQIMVHPEDRDLQRIYWHDAEGQLRSYRLTTVTYGLNCAPFLALRVLQQLIEDEGHRFPRAVLPMSRGRYVDDVFGGAESLNEAKEIIHQLKQLSSAGGFPLQKWNSNCPELLRYLSILPSDSSTPVELEASCVKVLGLYWQPNSDSFQFTSGATPSRTITKRAVLSEIAQLYDPLGFIAPVVICAKIFIQELWIAKVEWDEPLPPEIKKRWENFRQQLPSLNNLKIPRWLHVSSAIKSIELHGFSDASHLAMAAVVYIRVTTNLDEVYVTLVCAKTKVAPLKQLTIPRLELTAALLLSRLISNTKCALDLTECPIFLWTDSAVTLTWISANPARWKDFIRNRVTVIQEIVPSASWKFVPGKENPADCTTRGVNANLLEQHPLWWTGPPWLSKSSSAWPMISTSTSNTNLEERTRHVLTINYDSQAPQWDLLKRYSSLIRLFRITSLCRRAAARFRSKTSEPLDSPLTPLALQQSRNFWIKQIQNSCFRREIEALSRGENLLKSSSLIRLTPFLDTFGLLRVGGRLQHATLDYDIKHPFILPRQSSFTTLVIADAHLSTLHGGTQVTLAYTRQTYWILGGRAPIRSFILRCVRCARYCKIRAQQLMGQLPIARVTPSRSFLHTGVDYAGPISIKTWRGRAAKSYKGYLAIFVCFSTSAVHLEIVTDYTTEAFLAAYKRFTSRRGICASLYSDCGTNFVGADAELRRRFNSTSQELKELATLIATNGTEWRFNPPSAPHFGGKWEAAVKSTKFHLRRVIGDSMLTYEELSTLLAQIEAILNSRPLCPLTEDGDDYAALTPGHFLIGEALTTIPEPNLIDKPSSRLNRWQLIRQKAELFWKRWKSECLQRYQAISKWYHPSTQIKEGSLVLMIDDRYAPAKWPLARVVQLHPGEDGLNRVVTLRTSTAQFKRPITKICVLPPDPENETFGNFVPEGGRNVQENCKV